MRHTFAWGVFLLIATRLAAAGGFSEDLAFLRKHTDVIVLSASDAKAVVTPEYQGRVMTSTTGGPAERSFGWINRELIASGERQSKINAFGGEDRFWMGPEGGQYSIYFEKGEDFDLEAWSVPEPIDWGRWDVVSRGARRVAFRKRMAVTNYSGFTFRLRADRTVRLLRPRRAARYLGIDLPHGVRTVAFSTDNRITNTGEKRWRKETGLLSIWISGMFKAPATVVVPFRPGEKEALGRIVTDSYFGKIPSDRLKVDRERGVVYFLADARHRGKIGIPPARAEPILGSYAADAGVLTLVHYTLPAAETDYVNSLWKKQEHPYGGDVVNSYNDGPAWEGADQLGRFYELETSSPAAALAPGESLRHVQRTVHFTGDEDALGRVARATLGVGLDRITDAFD